MEHLKFTKDELKQTAADVFVDVINSYVDFVAQISKSLDTSFSEKESSEAENKVVIRKFSAIKKELYHFLSIHKEFFKLDKIIYELEDGTILYVLDISDVDDGEDFINKDVALRISEQCSDNTYVYGKVNVNTNKIVKNLNDDLGKSAITVEDVHKFMESNYFFNNKNFSIRKSNYKDLSAYIKQRTIDYCNAKISTENINEMSFSYRALTGVFEDIETCPICLENYKVDQEVCRLPCNHLCCKVCTSKLFSTPIDANPEEFGFIVSCPICRDNCA